MIIDILRQFLKLFTGTVERASPSDWVKDWGISSDAFGNVTVDLKLLNVKLSKAPKVWIPYIPNTNSMDGYFDTGNHNILISSDDPDDHKAIVDYLKAGDIAVYKTERMYAIHRIIKVGYDEKGKYFIFKGDNNAVSDPGRVRPSQIQNVSVGVIY